MSSRKLLDHIQAVGNASGAVPTAPSGLSGLKQAIESLPFSVDSGGMSSLRNVESTVAGLVSLLQEVGALGDLVSILRRSGLEGSLQDVLPSQLGDLMRGKVSYEELVEAVGPLVAMQASMRGRR